MLLQLRSKAPEERVSAYIGKQAEDAHAPVLLRGNVDVYKPDGKPLLFIRREVVSESAAALAAGFFARLREVKSYNRGAYAGGRFRHIRQDGAISNTVYATPVRSAVVGFMDRYARIPFCRESAYTTRYPEDWAGCLPQIREVAEAMKEVVPKRYALQLAEASKTHPAYVIPGTPFTTLTVNHTVAGAYHRDAGDFAEGFGAMTVHRSGAYTGCHLVFPAYGIAADLGDRDLALFDSHEVHGNTPFVAEGAPNIDFKRVSVVYYFRRKMVECLPPAEELERVKTLRGSIPEETDDNASDDS